VPGLSLRRRRRRRRRRHNLNPNPHSSYALGPICPASRRLRGRVPETTSTSLSEPCARDHSSSLGRAPSCTTPSCPRPHSSTSGRMPPCTPSSRAVCPRVRLRHGPCARRAVCPRVRLRPGPCARDQSSTLGRVPSCTSPSWAVCPRPLVYVSVRAVCPRPSSSVEPCARELVVNQTQPSRAAIHFRHTLVEVQLQASARVLLRALRRCRTSK
jgi:hypothetical protein